MKNNSSVLFDNTIEEICFLMKYLVGDEERENNLIIKLYRNSDENVCSINELEQNLYELVMGEHEQSSEFVEEEAEKHVSNISGKFIDALIATYFKRVRYDYKVGDERLRYLRATVCT